MAMSRKHYREVADILATEARINPDSVSAIQDVGKSLACMFKRDNPNFQPQKFYDAIGIY